MTASYRVYVDESGDEGFQFLEHERGSSRWLVLSAAVFRKSNDLEAVALMKAIRGKLGKPPRKGLHFREIKHEQRLPYVRMIGNARVRTVSVLIHKPSISEPEKFQSEAHRLYRYASRLWKGFRGCAVTIARPETAMASPNWCSPIAVRCLTRI